MAPPLAGAEHAETVQSVMSSTLPAPDTARPPPAAAPHAAMTQFESCAIAPPLTDKAPPAAAVAPPVSMRPWSFSLEGVLRLKRFESPPPDSVAPSPMMVRLRPAGTAMGTPAALRMTPGGTNI
eukprot:3523040-Prymnesium_polylepis.2